MLVRFGWGTALLSCRIYELLVSVYFTFNNLTSPNAVHVFTIRGDFISAPPNVSAALLTTAHAPLLLAHKCLGTDSTLHELLTSLLNVLLIDPHVP